MLTFQKKFSNDPIVASLQQLVEATERQNETLKTFLQQQNDLLGSFLVEGGTLPSGQTSPWTIDAQTGDVEIVTAIYSFFPAGATVISITLDDMVMQLPVGAFSSPGLAIPVRSNERIVRWTGNVTPFVVICARPAPSAVPGILHG